MTSAQSGRWADLVPRVLSAVAMLIVGGVELWLGGRMFHVFAGLVVALMMWELIRMVAPENGTLAVLCAVISGIAIAGLPEIVSTVGTFGISVLCVIVGAILGGLPGKMRGMSIPYGALILLGGLTLILVRDNLGLPWIFWLVFVVIASDVAGYFAGKTFGGPKFWPAISPKKTWSGTVAGWIGAGLVGVFFGMGSGILFGVVVLSILLAFAAQMGDIAESAIKRRTGVKDSSSLIPGHGGVLDRFDGLLGASVALLIIAVITGFPAGLI